MYLKAYRYLSKLVVTPFSQWVLNDDCAARLRAYYMRLSERRASDEPPTRGLSVANLKEPYLLRFLGFLFRGVGFDLPLALEFPLGFPLGLGLPFLFRGALAWPCNEIFIA